MRMGINQLHGANLKGFRGITKDSEIFQYEPADFFLVPLNQNQQMSSSLKNLNQFSVEGIGTINGKRVAVITAEWNDEVTFAMRDAAINFLLEHGLNQKDLIQKQVPGSFELIAGTRMVLERDRVDGVIAIGCVIQGETPHFTFISQAVAIGIAELNIQFGKPVIFGVLTTDNQEQAKERSGGKHGNKGIEAAYSLVKMLHF